MKNKTYWILFIVVLFELLLFTRYQAHDGTIHFFIHSLAAITVIFGIAAIAAIKGKDIKLIDLLAFTFLLHQYAMIPDYFYSFGILHQPWMNIFLGHLWLDNLWHHEIVLPILAILAISSCKFAKSHNQYKGHD